MVEGGVVGDIIDSPSLVAGGMESGTAFSGTGAPGTRVADAVGASDKQNNASASKPAENGGVEGTAVEGVMRAPPAILGGGSVPVVEAETINGAEAGDEDVQDAHVVVRNSDLPLAGDDAPERESGVTKEGERRTGGTSTGSGENIHQTTTTTSIVPGQTATLDEDQSSQSPWIGRGGSDDNDDVQPSLNSEAPHGKMSMVPERLASERVLSHAAKGAGGEPDGELCRRDELGTSEVGDGVSAQHPPGACTVTPPPTTTPSTVQQGVDNAVEHRKERGEEDVDEQRKTKTPSGDDNSDDKTLQHSGLQTVPKAANTTVKVGRREVVEVGDDSVRGDNNSSGIINTSNIGNGRLTGALSIAGDATAQPGGVSNVATLSSSRSPPRVFPGDETSEMNEMVIAVEALAPEVESWLSNGPNAAVAATSAIDGVSADLQAPSRSKRSQERTDGSHRPRNHDEGTGSISSGAAGAAVAFTTSSTGPCVLPAPLKPAASPTVSGGLPTPPAAGTSFASPSGSSVGSAVDFGALGGRTSR